MFLLAWRNLVRRPLRLVLTVLGVGLAVATLVSLAAFSEGYRRTLRLELDRSGVQLMLVPLGCPYDAAARVLKGRALDFWLPAKALDLVRADPAVAVAAPLLMVALPRAAEKRTDLWVGLDPSAREVKPWWRVESGSPWFTGTNAVILGADAAQIELRQPGDQLHSPELEATFRVDAVLARSGTSDDSLFFLPLATAQARTGQIGKLTAIAIRLRDPATLPAVAERLQRIEGAQVVTFTEMMGTFLNLVGAVRTLLAAIGLVAIAAGALGMLNTLFAAVVERADELCWMRALGASPGQVFALITLEAGMLGGAGGVVGVAAAWLGGGVIETAARSYVPLAPEGTLLALSTPVVLAGGLAALAAGLAAGLYPAWWAIRLPPARATRAE